MARIHRRSLLKRGAALGAGIASVHGANMIAQTPIGEPPTGDPIRIGASVSTSGTNGRTGLYQQEAYQLWEAQKNANGGLLGRPVEFVIYDDQSDPTTGARLYEKLITEDEVDLVLGPYASGVTQAVAQVTEQYGQPLLVAGASANSIWESGHAMVFGVYSVAGDYFKDIVTNIATEQGYTTAAVIYEDAVFPMSTGEGAVAWCEEAGIEVVHEEAYPQKATFDLIFEQIGVLKNEGLTLLLVEQNATRSLQISDRAYVLELGVNKYTGSGEALLADPRVRQLYLGG